MATYSQANRPISISTPLGEDALLLVGLNGLEGMSQLFSFHLDMLSPGGPVVFDRLLGQLATVRLEIPGSSQRFINGIVGKLTQKSRVFGVKENTPFFRYRMELVPRMWLLTQRFQSRIFQHLTVPEILDQVLHKEWRLPVDFRIGDRYDRRVRCVQYRETDFAFVSRLMEEEGIHYYFEHTQDAHTLVVSDGIGAPPKLQEPNQLVYDDFEGGYRDQTRIRLWEKTQEVRPYMYTVWDHCFELPGAHLEAVANMRDKVSAGKVQHRLDINYKVDDQEMLEIYDYPGGYSHRFDGIDKNGTPQPDDLKKIFTDNERTARIRIQQQAAQALTIEAAGNCGHLLPGHQFSLEHHTDADGPYLLTWVEHTARLEGTYLGGDHEEFSYENRFRCLPADLPFRPPLITPRPKVAGTQTATVVGPVGSEIHTDKYGRVKVQFPWDRTDIDQMQGGSHVLHDSSCWIRVSQTWAGKGFGAIHIPRVGQEVIVDFLEGDPDKPIVVGTVYNADQVPPFTLPDYASHMGIKSRSFTGNSDDFSHLTFEDFKGGEHVHMHSQKDMTHSAENHLVQNVGKEHHVHIGTRSYRQVGGLPGVEHSYWIGTGDTGVGGTSGGSGSGGGDGGPWYTVSPSDLNAGWASNQDVVYGWHTGNTCGLYTTLKAGINLSTTLNPFALDEFKQGLGLVTGMLSTALATGFTTGGLPGLYGGMAALAAPLARNAMGVGNVIIGTNNNIQYGRKIDVHYGNNYAPNRDKGARSWAYAGASLAAGAAYSALVLAQAFQPSLDSTSSKVEGAVLSEAVLIPFLFSVWAALEVEMTLVDYIQLADKATQASVLVNNNYYELAPEANVNGIQQPIQDVANNDNHGPDDEPGSRTLSSNSRFSVVAPLIMLTSTPSLDSDPEVPYGIVIQANGSDEMDGQVLVYGTGMACLQGGGEAYVNCATEEEVTGKVTIDCGEVGTIALQSGLTQEPNIVLLNPEGISLTSLLKIQATVEENSVTLDPVGITLASGPSSIAITPEGITLSCGPASVAITPEGVTISGPTVSITGDAAVTIT